MSKLNDKDKAFCQNLKEHGTLNKGTYNKDCEENGYDFGCPKIDVGLIGPHVTWKCKGEQKVVPTKQPSGGDTCDVPFKSLQDFANTCNLHNGNKKACKDAGCNKKLA